jgi:hypothetical protein
MKKEAKVEYGITITKPWSKEMYDHNYKTSSKYAQAFGMFIGTLRLIEAGGMTKAEIRKRLEVMDKDIWKQIHDDSVENLSLNQ